ncbi:MAG TPA: HDOD domain-containing protein [Gemmatirosa sp.]
MPVQATAVARRDARVAHLLQADDVPAFSKAMQELMAAVGRDDSSAQRLANVVLRDYALTAKVIRAANAAHYNRTGRSVQSVTHALMLLGARTVRDLASALLLFEHYRRRSPGLKELMLLSLLTASAARATAERCGAGVDADAAYLAGMFRNLGEVLVAAHLPDEYAVALAAVSVAPGGRETPRSAPALAVARAFAAREALGCSYEEIGATVARHWGMPDGVRIGMHADGGPGEDLGATCTAFAHDLTTAVHRGEPVHGPPEMTRLLAHYGNRLHLTREALRQIAERAVDETREIFAAAGVRLDDLRLARQLAAAMLAAREGDAAHGSVVAPTTVTAPVAVPVAPAPAGAVASCDVPLCDVPLCDVPSCDVPPCNVTQHQLPDATPAVATGPTVVELRARLAAELRAAAADPAYDLARVLTLALEAVLRGGPFDRACFHTADPVAHEFRPRTGLGDRLDQLLAGPGVPFDGEQGRAGPALRRGEEVHLAHGVRLTLAESQLLRRWQVGSAALHPVRVGGAVIGCVHADRQTAGTLPDATATQYVRAVVRALEGALAQRRAGTVGGRERDEGDARPVVRATDGREREVKMDAVLRVLRGERVDVVAGSVGVAAEVVEGWKEEFLEGGAERLSGR